MECIAFKSLFQIKSLPCNQIFPMDYLIRYVSGQFYSIIHLNVSVKNDFLVIFYASTLFL